MDRGGKGEGDLKRAFGVKSGMKFLARREKDREQSQGAQEEALEDLERFPRGGGGENVREETEILRGEELSKIETNLNTGNNTISSRRTGQGQTNPSSPSSSRRKPVPPLSSNEPSPISNSSPPIRPQASNSSSTPLALHQDPIHNASPLPRRVPPISGLNQSQTQDVKGRKRNDSGGSTGSVSKDDVLRELSEGIRKERRRKEMFEEEKRKAKLEVRLPSVFIISGVNLIM